MKSRRILLSLCFYFFGVAGALSFGRGQDRDQAFEPAMSLEETMTWLGKQLTQQHRVVSPTASPFGTVARDLSKRRGVRSPIGAPSTRTG
jgi:hypothetical protein